MTTHIPNSLRDLVINRAEHRCEYCLLHQDDEPIEHFALDGAVIVPLTAVGRTTVQLLKLNRPRIIQRRVYLGQLGRYPRSSV